MTIHRLGYGLLLGAVLAVLGCEGDDTLAGGCSGSVASESRTGNTINVTGSFSGGQPIMRLTRNGTSQQYVAGNYTGTTASFDITGVTPGTYTVTWILSCNNADGEVVMQSGVTTITIS